MLGELQKVNIKSTQESVTKVGPEVHDTKACSIKHFQCCYIPTYVRTLMHLRRL